MLNKNQFELAKTVSDLAYCNPFLSERIELEQQALGTDFSGSSFSWSMRGDLDDERPDIKRIVLRAEELMESFRSSLLSSAHISKKELDLYEDLALFILYHRFNNSFQELIEESSPSKKNTSYFYIDFKKDANYFFNIDKEKYNLEINTAHIFSIFFQIRRAFYHIFSFIVGGSKATTKLRASVWQSIFTHDLKRYERHLYKIMGDMTTLITGPSGTGKELVARAIGMSRYIPFDVKTTSFKENFRNTFHPLNISALSPTLVESELFGHKKGAFTGAISDRSGWLESCSPQGTVFLDEIGELDSSIQVKLLRVIQDKVFQRIGERQNRSFSGKIITATNRNLAEEMEKGSFREDFYYRLCADIIKTPSLHEQLQNSPEELNNLVLFIAKQQAGDEGEALSKEVVTWINKKLGLEYEWPGNIRELEQCIRNVMIRNNYEPPLRPQKGIKESFTDEIISGALTAEELLGRYCTLVYSKTGSYQETAKKIGLDRRTVKAKINNRLLDKLKG